MLQYKRINHINKLCYDIACDKMWRWSKIRCPDLSNMAYLSRLTGLTVTGTKVFITRNMGKKTL